MRKVVAAFIIFTLTFLVIAAVLIATGHASTPEPRPNALGAPQFFSNPYVYLLGLPIDGQLLEGKYTSIRFAPYAAPDLYDVSILFCRDVTPMFEGKRGVLILTYRAQASQAYKGVGCHALLSVIAVPEK